MANFIKFGGKNSEKFSYSFNAGYSAAEIGSLSAIMAITKIVAPNLWGWLGDKTGRRLEIIRLGSLLSVIIFCGIFLFEGFWALVVIVAGYSFFWNGLLAQFEVIVLAYLKDTPENYARARLWGSAGFLLLVIGLGYLFDVISVSFLPLFLAAVLAMIFVSSLTFQEGPAGTRHRTQDANFWATLTTAQPLIFFGSCFLMQLSHGPYYTFFSVFLEDHHYSRAVIGWLWALGVIAEIVIFLYMHKLLPRWGIKNLLLLSFWATALRWVITGCWPDQTLLLIFAQCLHAFSFGTFHAAAIEWVRQVYQHGGHGQAQAFYAAISYGAGGALGAWLTGLVWQDYAVASFVIAGLICTVGALLLIPLKASNTAQGC